MPTFVAIVSVPLSLSARRAWIEIVPLVNGGDLLSVALRKESVDRNAACAPASRCWTQSLSARRAWIEISSLDDILAGVNESLSARRAWIEIKYVVKDSDFSGSRSPQGERG